MSDLAVLEPRDVVITTEQTDLIKRTICQEATDAEMRLFFYDCQRRGVHPLDKLIHFTKRGKSGAKKYVPITSIDFFRIRAHGSGVFAGEEKPTFEVGADGYPDTCDYIVYRFVNGQRFPWTATARWTEYYPGDEVGFNWKKMPFLMLAKCAEALALRKAFPAELQGLYVKEEMDQAGPEKTRKPSEILADSEKQGHNAADILARSDDALDTAHMAETQQASEAPALDDPAEEYRVKLRVCERTSQAITHTYNAIPPEIRQDCHTEFQAQLRNVTKKK